MESLAGDRKADALPDLQNRCPPTLWSACRGRGNAWTAKGRELHGGQYPMPKRVESAPMVSRGCREGTGGSSLGRQCQHSKILVYGFR